MLSTAEEPKVSRIVRAHKVRGDDFRGSDKPRTCHKRSTAMRTSLRTPAVRGTHVLTCAHTPPGPPETMLALHFCLTLLPLAAPSLGIDTLGELSAAATFTPDAVVEGDRVVEGDWPPAVDRALELAGDNRSELEAAWAALEEDQRPGMEFLIEHMPVGDLRGLSKDFLLEHVTEAYAAWELAPWSESMGDQVFLEHVLPYASINERRDAWRKDLRERCAPWVSEARTASEAAVILNQRLFKDVGVIYSTKRPKADQSPYESIEAGMASCTGLSVLLIDACRAVGVPARFVGTPHWSDDSGNHSWVEIWDDGWHFTGAAEPSGDDLNKAWFTGRASSAKPDSDRYGIFAVSYKRTPQRFPMVWRPDADWVFAVNVTDRYIRTAEPLPEGHGRLRIGAAHLKTGERLAAEVSIQIGAERRSLGVTRDERFDTNDLLEVVVPLGEPVQVSMSYGGVARLDTLTLDGPEHLHMAMLDPRLTEELAAEAIDELLSDATRIRRQVAQDRLEKLELTAGDKTMPFWWTTFGEAPEGGHSLWISMHGGGGAPARVNDQQWENQKRLYSLEEGIYVAPRAPTNSWNLWHEGHIDTLFDQLVADFVWAHGVNPDRVYLLGYSAGGDGVYQLAPRMADRWAGAAMMAGHPNDARPEGLRNLAFTLHMGGEDGAYDRNKVAEAWKKQLGDLHQADPEGYDHWVEIHDGKGHWMDREDAAALPWMAERTRNLRPQRVVWVQSGRTHERFYWLRNPEPKPGAKVIAELRGQDVQLLEASGVERLVMRLDDSMLDLDQPLRVIMGQEILFEGRVERDLEVIRETFRERGDPRGIWTAEIEVELPKAQEG